MKADHRQSTMVYAAGRAMPNTQGRRRIDAAKKANGYWVIRELRVRLPRLS
jgi:hypothetical protein